MKIAIVGWGLEGQSAYRYFGSEHEYLIVNEEPRNDFPKKTDKIDIQFIDELRTPGVTSNVSDLSYLKGIKDCDKIVYTPTVRKNLEKLFPQNDSFWQKATTNQHIFFEEVKTKNIIGVTGSKGKGTTSSLLALMLESAGKKVHFGGNVGRPVLDFVKEVAPSDWVVLELANFQLYKFPYSPHIGVCLMLTHEHLDWHPDIDDYLEAKSNLFRHQTKEDVAIYFASDKLAAKIATYSKGKLVPYYRSPGARLDSHGNVLIGEEPVKIINKSEIKLLGEHNLQNVCAALTTAWQVTKSPEAFARVLRTFSGLEHRLEFVRELESVKYYDDSFGTTPDTAKVAIQAFSEPKVLVLGGSDKGLPYEELVEEIAKSKVRHVITIGITGPKIAKLLRTQGINNITEGLQNMSDIVAEARNHAHAGDVVLLSTASASFGLFKDYKDRGNQFKKAVKVLT